MAEILIMWADKTHNPGHPDLHKRGDAIAVEDDGFEWGRLERLPPERGGAYVRLKVPGVTKAEFLAGCKADLGRTIFDPEDVPINVGGAEAMEGAGSPSKRTALRFDLDHPATFGRLAQDRMASGGAQTITAAQLDLILSRKANGKTRAQGRAERIAREAKP